MMVCPVALDVEGRTLHVNTLTVGRPPEEI